MSVRLILGGSWLGCSLVGSLVTPQTPKIVRYQYYTMGPKNGVAAPKGKRQPSRKLPMRYIPPSSRRATLTWSGGAISVESAASLGATHFYRLNGAYDVDTNVGSTSTPGFAEYANFFANYRVWRTRVQVEGTASGSSSGAHIVALVPNSYTPTIPSATAAWLVQPMSVQRLFANVTSGGSNVLRLDQSFDLPRLARLTRAQYADDMDFTANTAAVPSRQMYVAVANYSLGSSTVATFVYQILVSMEIEFFNPITLTI